MAPSWSVDAVPHRQIKAGSIVARTAPPPLVSPWRCRRSSLRASRGSSGAPVDFAPPIPPSLPGAEWPGRGEPGRAARPGRRSPPGPSPLCRRLGPLHAGLVRVQLEALVLRDVPDPGQQIAHLVLGGPVRPRRSGRRHSGCRRGPSFAAQPASAGGRACGRPGSTGRGWCTPLAAGRAGRWPRSRSSVVDHLPARALGAEQGEERRHRAGVTEAARRPPDPREADAREELFQVQVDHDVPGPRAAWRSSGWNGRGRSRGPVPRSAVCARILSRIHCWAAASLACGALSVRVPPDFFGTSNWT